NYGGTLADLDPIEAGLELERQKLEALAAKLSSEASPPGPWDTEQAKDLGGAIGEAIGVGLRAIIFRERPEKPIRATPRPRNHFFSRTQPAVMAPPPPVAAAPAPAVAPAE